MDKFTNNVLNYIRTNELIKSGDMIVVGFSGGADSVSLLLVLNELKRLLKTELLAVHVHHGIRGTEADRDEAFCRELTAKENIPYRAAHVDAPLYAREHGLTEEEAGRILRYEYMRSIGREFFSSAEKNLKKEKFLSDGNRESLSASDNVPAQETGISLKIAVAHHADDQAETIIFNLLRGSGLRGLGGMQPTRDDIIRPLLCVTKDDILSWLDKRKVNYVTDSTNLENDHTRNRIRNVIIPELKASVNEKASEHITEAGAKIFEADKFIRDEARTYIAALGKSAVRREDGSIAFALGKYRLKEKKQIFRIYVIIEALSLMGIPLKDWGDKHFNDIDKLLFMGKGAHIDLPGDAFAENEGRETFILHQPAAKTDTVS